MKHDLLQDELNAMTARMNVHLLVDRLHSDARQEIRAMAEHARRCIGQRHRRNQELLVLTRVRVTGNVRFPK